MADMSMNSNDSNDRGNHRINPVRLVLRSRPAQIYLGVVAATGAFVAISQATHTAPDANLSAVWAIFVTLPWSLVGTMVVPELEGQLNIASFVGIITLSALVNASLIAWATQSLTKRRR